MATLKAQDILVALAIEGRAREEWSYSSLGQSLGLSPSALHRATTRLETSGLFDARRGEVRPAQLLEFLVHGLKYVFPPVFGAPTRGLPTGPSAPPLSSILVPDSASSDANWVWPYAQGTQRGTSVEPLTTGAVLAATMDEKLYHRLAVVDALRGGRARERNLAEEWLREELGLA